MLRRTELGFIFQAFNLAPTLSARENIVLPLTIAGRKADPVHFANLVAAFGLSERLDHRPKVISADEPTGSVDSRSSGQVPRFLR